MNELPLGYERVPPTTWAYLSSLLLLAVYFKFSRVWSVRNLDLILIILLAPGLLSIHFGAASRERIRNQIADRIERLEQVSEEQPQTPPLDAAPPPSSQGPVGQEPEREQVDGQTQLLRDSFDPSDPLAAERDSRFDSIRVEFHDSYYSARRLEHRGYLWLFLVGALVLIRMLIDPLFIRRPLLEPNLSSGGLTFMGSSMLVFMLLNLMTASALSLDLYFVPEVRAEMLWPEAEVASPETESGPGYRPLSQVPLLPMLVDTTRSPNDPTQDRVLPSQILFARIIVVISLTALVVGLVLIGSWHFENFWMGTGIATLFLMLPYSVQMTGRTSHVLPAALLVWALAAYRMPFFAGLALGAASGLIYYPLFLLPLWLSFYWRRGFGRFGLGVCVSLASLLIGLWIFGDGQETFSAGIRQMFGLWFPRHNGLGGIWALGWEPVFRLPMIAGALAIAGSLAIWPSRKNLATLISGSCAVMIAVQFWDGYHGGLSMAWYLPLALLTFFRPNLEDKTAERMVRDRSRAKTNGAPAPSSTAV